MMTIPQSSYFPPLDKCLDGQRLLISWKTTFSAISHSDDAAVISDIPAIQNFLSDPDAIKLLSTPYDAFPEPSPQTKSAFETKTSAINVTPSLRARYDIKQVKEDSLWLSTVAKVDELSALRVVVEECQSRTSVKLLGRFSNEELASIQEATGSSKLFSSMPASLFAQGIDPEFAEADFETETSRRIRILQTYLSERRYLLSCAQKVHHKVIYFEKPAPYVIAEEKGKKVASAAKLDIYRAVRENLADPTPFLSQCFEAIEENMRRLETGSGWNTDDGRWEVLELEWITTQIVEIIITMGIIFQVLDSSPLVSSSIIVLRWFRLFRACGFFEEFGIDDPSVLALIPPMQSMAAVISLSILSVGSCLEYLGDFQADTNAMVSSDDPDTRPYILNTRTLTDIHTIMMDAAAATSATTGPALLAWVSLLQMIRTRVVTKSQEPLDYFEDSSSGLRRQLSSDGEESVGPDAYQIVINDVMDSTEDDPVKYLGMTTVFQCHVFQTLSEISLRLGGRSSAFFSSIVGARARIIILELLRCSNEVGYIPEVVEANISALTGGQTYWDSIEGTDLQTENDPLASFWKDPELVTMFLQAARLRYPYESLPYLSLVRALAACSNCLDGDGHIPAIQFLRKIPTFTYQLPAAFVSYETAQEEENNNNVRLTEPVPLFKQRSRGRVLQGRSTELLRLDEDLVIGAGSNGRIISDSGPKVALWFHEYSGLKYLGKLVGTFLTAGDEVDAMTGTAADRETVAEIIDIFAMLIFNITKTTDITSREGEFTDQFLQVASSGLSRNRDITAVIFDIFEEELQRQSTPAGSDFSLEVLVSCVHFIHAVLLLSPGLVWPLLARSGLLGISSGGGSRLFHIVENVEMVSGRYDLLISCSYLFEALVEDFVSNALARTQIKDFREQQAPRSRFAPRTSDQTENGTGISDQVLSKVLLSITRYLVDTLESSCTWKFAEPNDRLLITTTIVKILDNILHYSYGLAGSSLDSIDTGRTLSKPVQLASDDRFSTEPDLLRNLFAAASHVADSFLSTTSGSLRFQPLLRALYEGLLVPEIVTLSNESHLGIAQVKAVLSFSEVVLRVGILLRRPISQLETQLFRSAPILARLYAFHTSYKVPVISLFEALVVSSGRSATEPPSLLGHLGPRTAKNFIHILSDFDKPLSSELTVTSIWHFFSMVISNRQQWFANYLLTGKTPKDTLGSRSSGTVLSALDNPPLTTALDPIIKLKDIPRTRAVAILQFVALAQNCWPWTVHDSGKQADFVGAISDFIGTLPPIQPYSKADEELEASYQTRIAAYIAQILAMHLFHSRHTRSTSIIKDVVSNLAYYARFAVTATGYNVGTENMLNRNFITNSLGDPQVFKRSTLEPQQYGEDYFYDLSVADKMLSRLKSWKGVKDAGGFRYDLIRANANLCLVDAQIALLGDWKYLAIELSNHMADSQTLQSLLSKVALDCLKTNAKTQQPEEIFAKLTQSRADFALVLVQRLTEVNSKACELQKLFEVVWTTIRSLRGTFERSLEGADLIYYRTLLKLLFLAPSVHMQGQKEPLPPKEAARALASPIIPIVLDVLRLVVADGIREAVATIHEKPNEALPEDFALLTGILQSCLRIPGIELCHAQIVSTMVAADAARVATTLFSWSDNLAIDGDPVYGELSVLFLLELSSMPLMAEQLAIDGVLGQLGAANITSYLRRGNVSPFADGAGLQRCYNIWVRGLLPLLLNLLDSVQASIASEVAIFLNQFPALLEQSAQFIEAPDSARGMSKTRPKFLTLSICSEIHSIALLFFILNGFRSNPIAAGIAEIPEVKWDSAGVLENVDFWLGSKGVLRERILPLGARDVELARKKMDGAHGGFGKVATRLEEKVVAELAGIRDVLSSDG